MDHSAVRDVTALTITNIALGLSVVVLWGIVLVAAIREGWGLLKKSH